MTTTETKKSFQIYSTAGMNAGVFEGATKAEALLAAHRDAGYGSDVVWLDADGDLSFSTQEYREMCGDVEDWDIEEVAG